MNKEFIINNIVELNKVSEFLLGNVDLPIVILLKGNLGAGKTSFASSFINKLSNEGKNVTSPTFNILQIYNGKEGDIYHYDLYRIKSAEELEEIEFFEAINNKTTLIEWPEKLEEFGLTDYLPENIVNIDIGIIEGEKRLVKISL